MDLGTLLDLALFYGFGAAIVAILYHGRRGT